MRKIVLGCAAVLLSLGLLAGCNNDTDSAVSITVDTSASVVVGESLELPYTVEPEKAKVEALTDHEEYVTASAKDGVLSLEGVAAGDATVTLVGTYKKYTEANVNIAVSVITEAEKDTEPGVPDTGGDGNTGGDGGSGTDNPGTTNPDEEDESGYPVAFEEESWTDGGVYALGVKEDDTVAYLSSTTDVSVTEGYSAAVGVRVHAVDDGYTLSVEGSDKYIGAEETQIALVDDETVLGWDATNLCFTLEDMYLSAVDGSLAWFSEVPEEGAKLYDWVLNPTLVSTIENGTYKLGLDLSEQSDGIHYLMNVMDSSYLDEASSTLEPSEAITLTAEVEGDDIYLSLVCDNQVMYVQVATTQTTPLFTETKKAVQYSETYGIVDDAEDPSYYLTWFGYPTNTPPRYLFYWRQISAFGTSYSDVEYVPARLYHVSMPHALGLDLVGDEAVYVGNSVTLSTTIWPNCIDTETYTFASADEAASVDSITGVVSGVSAKDGVVITATASNGLTATHEINIETAPEAICAGTYDFSKKTDTTNSTRTTAQMMTIFNESWVADQVTTSPIDSVTVADTIYAQAGGSSGNSNANLQLSTDCIKFGKGSTAGELEFTLSGFQATKVAIVAAGWTGAQPMTINSVQKSITQSAKEVTSVDAVTTYEFDITASSTINLKTSERVLVFSMTLYGIEA